MHYAENGSLSEKPDGTAETTSCRRFECVKLSKRTSDPSVHSGQRQAKGTESSVIKGISTDGLSAFDSHCPEGESLIDETRLATKRTWEISNDPSEENARPFSSEHSSVVMLGDGQATLVWGTKNKRNTLRKGINSNTVAVLKRMLAEKTVRGHVEQVSAKKDLREATVLGSARTSRTRGARHSSRARKAVFASLAETSDEEQDAKPKPSSKKKKVTVFGGDKAISTSGYTCRGRVKQKAQKRVELMRVGEKRLAKGWFNAGYIFPLGFKSKTQFRSSLRLDGLCVHECEIVRGEFWPLPTFVITAHDRPNEKLVSKSCTGCWSLVLKRINDEITRRRKAGEDLPPPPKTAIAGPEYFGLIQPDILRKIEAIDTEKACDIYWAGKLDRQVASRNLSQLSRHRPDRSTFSSYAASKKRIEYESEEDDDDGNAGPDPDGDGDDDDDAGCTLNKWSALCRTDRYRQRCINRGSLPDSTTDNENPLPDLIDLITMQPVVTPAISPYGHVMGIATWRAWLSENRVCPFTRNPLTIEQCTILTKNNIDRYRGRIANLS